MVLRLFRLKTRCCDALKVVPESLRLVLGILVGMIGRPYAIRSTDGREAQSDDLMLFQSASLSSSRETMGKYALTVTDKDQIRRRETRQWHFEFQWRWRHKLCESGYHSTRETSNNAPPTL